MNETRLIAGRYRVVRPLGQGGNAQVFEVIDERTEAHVALKLLSANEGVRQHVRDLFQREFNTLAELAHPLIVRVFDYGVDEAPYYTMELIVGSRLRERLPWAEACALLRDVASALSLVHSRRLVHRDVTHRNVYRTEDGHAKLFDFGALSPMGPVSDVVGTPPFIPPEAVAELRLDGRSDLFSLGALGYFLLTGQHAFPARSVGDLGTVWRRTVEMPSRFAENVPKPLDELITSLLSLDPIARPTSAAEVFNRLTAIANLPSAEAPEVAQAYLTSPSLVGREDATRHFQQLLARTHQGRGSSLVLDGARGFGRSRLLSSFLLEAKLDGFVILRADSASSDNEPFGVARKLVRQLIADDPVVARDAAGPNAALLEPVLFGRPSSPLPAGDDNSSAAVVDALSTMLVSAARVRPIIVGVDDFERADAQSKQFVIRLAKASHKSCLTLVVAVVQDAATEAHVLLRDLSSAVRLPAFSPAETRALVCSLFGDVAHVEAVSRWVHGLSDGRPWTALEAATHLVDSGIARFEEGSWVLPGTLEELELPASIDQAQDAKIAMLGPEVRSFCRALALSAEEDPLLFSEYGELVDGVSGATLDAALNELVARSILVPAASAFAFAHDGIRAAAARSIPEAERPGIHRRLAAAYGSSPTPSLILAAFHSLEAADVELAFSRAVLSLRDRRTISVRGSAFLRTVEGTRAFERLFEWGLAVRKPWPDVLTLGQMLLQHAAVADMTLVRHREPVMARLRLDSGLSDWEELSEIEDPLERIRTAVGRAFMRHESTPEADRGLPPLAAIEALCGATAGLTGAYARRAEPAEIQGILKQLVPFRPISPAVACVADMIATAIGGLLGRDVREARLRVADVLSSPVHGLEEVPRIGMHWLNLYYQALDDACRGRPNAAELARPLMQTGTYAPLAWEARVVEALFQGDVEGAEAARKERDLSKLTHSHEVHAQLEGAFPYEAAAFDFLGDLLRLKRCLPWLEERSKTCPQWTAYRYLYLGNYHRLRGELPKALAAYEQARSFAPVASERAEWSYTMLRLGPALVESGRAADAYELMTRVVPEAIAHGTLCYMRVHLEMALALSEAAVGLRREAVVRAERVMEEAVADGFGGILFVDLCKEQAKVAELAHDEDLLERAIVRLEQLATHGKRGAFAAKHAHLLRHAQGRGTFQVAANPQKSLSGTESTHTSLIAGVRTQIELCRGRSERARRALKILLDTAESDEGFLYLCDTRGVELAASFADATPPAALEAVLAERVRSFTADEDTTSDSAKLRSLRPTSAGIPFDVVEVLTETGGRLRLAALAALKPRKAALQPVPLVLRSALSDALITAGDTSGIPWA